MVCATRQRPPSQVAVPDRQDEPHARIGDAERERTAAVLADAVAAGYLRLDELDQRLAVVWSAATAGELRATEADLPAGLRRARDRRESAARARAAARAGLLPHLAAYTAVMVLLVAIWLAVGVSAGAWHPWPLWPALGWGIGVVGHVRAATRRTPAALVT